MKPSWWAIGYVAVHALGCSDAHTAKSGLGDGEPVSVHGGQFFSGALPRGASGPSVLTTDTQSTLLPQGSVSRKVAGDARRGAFAIAMRLDDIGSGYWVVPVSSTDPQTDGDVTYEVSYDVARDAAIGKHPMVFSAIDRSGNYGPITTLPIQIATLIPDGHDVISLEWDSNADVDLQVTTPEGKVVDPKHPSTAIAGDAGIDPTKAGTGVLDHDSNGGCVIDDYREESLVWKDAGTPGPYQIRVNLADACGTGGASFVVTWRRDGVVRKRLTGRVSDVDANGGAAPGLFVGTFVL